MLDVSLHSLRSLFSDERLLGQLALIWGWREQDSRPTPAQLVERMADHHAARDIWEQLTQSERACLYRALSSTSSMRSRGVPLSTLCKKTKLEASVVEAAVRTLSERWLLLEEGEVEVSPTKVQAFTPSRGVFVFRECCDSLLSTGRELFESYGDRRLLPLSRLLEEVASKELEDLGRLCRISVTLSFPAYSSRSFSSINTFLDRRGRIASALLSGTAAVEVFLSMAPEVRHLFHWLCEQDGQASIQEVRAFLGKTSEQLPALLRHLLAYGLAFETFTREASRLLFIPGELLSVVRQEVLASARDEQTYALVPCEGKPAMIRTGQPILCYDLATIIGTTYHSVLDTTKDGRLPKQKRAKLRPLLHGLPRTSDGQDYYVDQLLHAARALGLLLCIAPSDEEKPRYQPTGPKLSAWASGTIVEQCRRFVDWWSSPVEWYDVAPDGRLFSASSSEQTMRKKLLDVLASLTPQQSYGMEAILVSVWKQQPIQGYDRDGSRPPKGSSLLAFRRKQWMASEGQRVVGMLTSTLFEAGLVSLGYTSETPDEGASPAYVQLTALGAAVLANERAGERNSSSPWMATSDRVLIVQPSFEVIVLELNMPVLYELLSFAQIKHIGPVSTFQLTQAALLQGLEAGKTLSGIVELLSRHSQKELPQNVVYTLSDWTKDYKEVTLSEVFLLELASPRAEEALCRALEGLAVEVRKLAPLTYIVTAHDLPSVSLRKALREARIVVRAEKALASRRASG